MPETKGDPGAEDPRLAVRSVLLTVGRTLLATRLELRLPQRELAARADVSQALICAIERAQISDLPISTLAKVLDGADIEFELVLRPPHAETDGRQRDPAHARCVAHVRSRLEQAGWQVATEVEVVSGRSHGWIDVLAYHPAEHVLLVIEVKTEIRDVGAVDRQLGWYVRSAWDAAHRLGWRPRAVVGSLLILTTEENDERLRARGTYAQGYPVRARELAAFIADPSRPPRRGLHALAMIDPSSRRTEWLRPAAIDGRRSPAPHRDYADFIAKRGRRSGRDA